MTNDELIVKHLEGWSGLSLESVKYYGETGHVSGSLLIALRGMLVDKENEVKNLALPHVINNEVAACVRCNKPIELVDNIHCKQCQSETSEAKAS